MNRVRAIACAILFGGTCWVLLAAAVEPPSGKADIRGTATRVSLADEAARKRGILATILVEGAKEKTTSYDKASIRITDKTKLEKRVDKERKTCKPEDLKVGCKVQAIFTGPVAESYPVQATAREVLILETPR